MMALRHRILALVATLAAAAAFAPAASATTSPSLQLDQSAGTTAGAEQNLVLDLGFANSNADSPDDLTLNLPAGLLANVALDGGRCLTSDLIGNRSCELGTGTVDAEVVPAGLLTIPIAVPISITYYLTPPPAAGDLAGIAVYGLGQQIGSTGGIVIRPSTSADGVGATIDLTLPDALPAGSLPPPISTVLQGLVKLSLTAVDSTFDNLRYPTTCPSSPQHVTGTVTSYQDSVPQPISAPLTVTGCGNLEFRPTFSLSARRDSSDRQVTLETTIDEPDTDAPSRSIGLRFPSSVVLPDLASLGALCRSSSLSGCTRVGSVTATSPLYPSTLTGAAYLTASTSGLGLTLAFPPPFPITLVGAVNLPDNSATFSGLPDLPLSSLTVTLDGGSQGLFLAQCATPSGTATAALTDQSGLQSRQLSAPFTVSGCPGAGTSGSGSTSASPTSSTSSGSSASVAGTRLVAQSIAGLSGGRPSLRFTVSAARRAAAIRQITLTLPAGLSLRTHRQHGRLAVRGVRVSGASVLTVRSVHDRLVIVLRRRTRRAVVVLTPASLAESRGLRALVERRRVTRLRLRVAVRGTDRRTRTLTVTVHL